jgi:hypothetical protein
MTDIYNAILPWRLFRFTAIHNVKSLDGWLAKIFLERKFYFFHLDISILRRLGLASFSYMIIFAGLEFTITFLVYNRFNWDR